jgi:hypothetical protein
MGDFMECMELSMVNYINNVGQTVINHPFGNGWNPTYVWWFGGWFIIVLPALYGE